MTSVLKDHFEPTLWPLLHLKPAFDYPIAIFSPFQRLLRERGSRLAKEELPVSASVERPEGFYENYIQERYNLSVKIKTVSEPEEPLTPAGLLESFSAELHQDISLLSRENFPQATPPCHIEGAVSGLWISPEARISPMAAIDTSEGPVVIEAGAKVGPFCFLKGPLYIGPDCYIDNAHIAHSRIGRASRIGGEVADTLIGDFSNKHHEGFLGHSLVGEWVNLGALTTTSDLKNNYGKIKLNYGKEEFPTGVIKFGSIIGNFVKTAIGTMLNTGTILDVGANIFAGRPSLKYYPPFFWGGEPAKYQAKRFLEDAAAIMKRRGQKPGDVETEILRELLRENQCP